ncbi:PGAP1-like protein [Nitrosospira briensis]|uniref:PGAP1-like protein n=1 Tax=Nitrosospira briensis TaxID=35799 RepID=A0A1I4YU75_9PROT|nr:hypothetical protein [Nitrosospira briensis]SFN41596.1 PGAP1-like protein [Nitrosospira briensis]
MGRIVIVHGIGQQFKGSHTLHEAFLPALRDGLDRVGVDFSKPEDLVCAFYGDLFRKKSTKSLMHPPYEAVDVSEGLEQDLLALWWQEAAQSESQVPGPYSQTKSRAPNTIQRALNALSKSKFFTEVAERAMIGDLKQVRSYLEDQSVREQIQERIVNVMQSDSKVLIGHSLGSIVAYEALCAHPEWSIQTFITLGSPLGIRNLIFDRLRPSPAEGMGIWPGNTQQWINIADGGDIVALEKELRSRFGNRVHDELIYNGATAHDIRPYLTAQETGRAIAAAIGER